LFIGACCWEPYSTLPCKRMSLLPVSWTLPRRYFLSCQDVRSPCRIWHCSSDISNHNFQPIQVLRMNKDYLLVWDFLELKRSHHLVHDMMRFSTCRTVYIEGTSAYLHSILFLLTERPKVCGSTDWCYSWWATSTVMMARGQVLSWSLDWWLLQMMSNSRGSKLIGRHTLGCIDCLVLNNCLLSGVISRALSVSLRVSWIHGIRVVIWTIQGIV
jgi:hypothetical protein